MCSPPFGTATSLEPLGRIRRHRVHRTRKLSIESVRFHLSLFGCWSLFADRLGGCLPDLECLAIDAVSDIPTYISMRAVEWLVELQSRDAPEATRKALEHWLNLERAWQCTVAINGRLKEWTFPTDLAIAHNNSAVRKTSRPLTARIRDESQPAHGQRKAS